MGSLNGAPIAVPDDYQSLADLLGLVGSNARLVEGFIQAQDSGVTVRFGDQTQPATSAGGTKLSDGSAMGIGPVRDPATAWPLDQIWVRETTAAGGASVSVLGVTA